MYDFNSRNGKVSKRSSFGKGLKSCSGGASRGAPNMSQLTKAGTVMNFNILCSDWRSASIAGKYSQGAISIKVLTACLGATVQGVAVF